MIFPEGREHFPDLFNYGTVYFEGTSLGRCFREHTLRNTTLVQLCFFTDRKTEAQKKQETSSRFTKIMVEPRVGFWFFDSNTQ